MFHTLEGSPDAGKKIERLKNQALKDIAATLYKTNLLTNGFDPKYAPQTEATQLFMQGLLQGFIENTLLLNSLGSPASVWQSMLLPYPKAMEWFDTTAKRQTEVMQADTTVMGIVDAFSKDMSAALGELEDPLPDELGDDEALTESDKEKLREVEAVREASREEEDYVPTLSEVAGIKN